MDHTFVEGVTLLGGLIFRQLHSLIATKEALGTSPKIKVSWGLISSRHKTHDLNSQGTALSPYAGTPCNSYGERTGLALMHC
jgi:hypothetical protein